MSHSADQDALNHWLDTGELKSQDERSEIEREAETFTPEEEGDSFMAFMGQVQGGSVG